MKEKIQNLKELKRLFCLDCKMRQNSVSCCVCGIEPRLCDYVVSLNFVIELLEKIDSETK
jgi:hypothetical protein